MKVIEEIIFFDRKNETTYVFREGKYIHKLSILSGLSIFYNSKNETRHFIFIFLGLFIHHAASCLYYMDI